MESSTKIRINVKSGEVEFQGSEAFVEKQIANLENIIALFDFENDNNEDIIETGTIDNAKIDAALKNSDESITSKTFQIPDSLGEWIHMFKADLMDIEKVLIVGYYVQMNSDTKDFKTNQVSSKLKEYGYNLSNPTSLLTLLVKKKLIFQTKKVGTLKFMRVSVDGENYLKSLLN